METKLFSTGPEYSIGKNINKSQKACSMIITVFMQSAQRVEPQKREYIGRHPFYFAVVVSVSILPLSLYTLLPIPTRTETVKENVMKLKVMCSMSLLTKF